MQQLNNCQTVIFLTFMHLVFACMCHCTPPLPVRIFCQGTCSETPGRSSQIVSHQFHAHTHLLPDLLRILQ